MNKDRQSVVLNKGNQNLPEERIHSTKQSCEIKTLQSSNPDGANRRSLFVIPIATDFVKSQSALCGSA